MTHAGTTRYTPQEIDAWRLERDIARMCSANPFAQMPVSVSSLALPPAPRTVPGWDNIRGGRKRKATSSYWR